MKGLQDDDRKQDRTDDATRSIGELIRSNT